MNKETSKISPFCLVCSGFLVSLFFAMARTPDIPFLHIFFAGLLSFLSSGLAIGFEYWRTNKEEE